VGNKIVGLADVDLYGGLGTNAGQTLFFNGPAGPNGNGSGKYLNSQAISAYGWSSVGNPNYNALQVSLRKQFSQGLQFDLNYASPSRSISPPPPREWASRGLGTRTSDCSAAAWKMPSA
jgi:hypothetical protein